MNERSHHELGLLINLGKWFSHTLIFSLHTLVYFFTYELTKLKEKSMQKNRQERVEEENECVKVTFSIYLLLACLREQPILYD